ncbi:hypothetical protein GKZ90_0012375 [Flavobacterium sp. MC2016-06]|jgi:hypothetical protein|uniref:hypothetical protein n=1 Tax=Flavobacterium sp. MC2016-06 TaxID=2676308 RepID=UPI0012BA9198|nr:hypothetical protein [Flavobacterium sp. MC2016-06]MBU3860105.1 hypothetical protein [Flavobacterium sp. MC2016-06]
MDYTPKDLGETPKTPDMSNFKNPLGQPSEGSIFIESFNISPLSVSEKNESLTEAIKKESRDSSV